MPVHVMRSDDTLVSLSEAHGLYVPTIWNHANNEELRARRKRYDALAPGDEVFIPDCTERAERLETGKRHRFVRLGIPAKIRLQVRAEGQPSANREFQLDVGGRVVRGFTDSNGVLEAFVPASCRAATLRFRDNGDSPIELKLGSMEPDNTIAGVRKRLSNLGIAAPEDDDLSSHGWRLALYAFQQRLQLPASMQLDAATNAALLRVSDRVGAASVDADGEATGSRQGEAR